MVGLESRVDVTTERRATSIRSAARPRCALRGGGRWPVGAVRVYYDLTVTAVSASMLRAQSVERIKIVRICIQSNCSTHIRKPRKLQMHSRISLAKRVCAQAR